MKPTAVALALALTAAGHAWAGLPLVSETADAIAAGEHEIEMAYAQARARGTPTQRGWDLMASLGIGGHTQAGLGYGRARADGASVQSVQAIAKTMLVAPEDGRTGWALRYGLSFDRADGAGWRGEGLEVLGVMTRELTPGLLVHANLGHAHSRAARQGSTVWSVGLETTAETTLAADLFGDDRSRPWVSAGVGTRLAAGLSVNLSLAVQFENPRLRQLTLGAKLAF